MYKETDRQENRLYTNSERCTHRLSDRKTDDIKIVKNVQRLTNRKIWQKDSNMYTESDRRKADPHLFAAFPVWGGEGWSGGRTRTVQRTCPTGCLPRPVVNLAHPFLKSLRADQPLSPQRSWQTHAHTESEITIINTNTSQLIADSRTHWKWINNNQHKHLTADCRRTHTLKVN